MDLEQVGAVLELVLLPLDLPGQLPGLPDGHEPGPEPVGDRRGEDQAARLDPEDLGHAPAVEVVAERVDHEAIGLGVAQQRRDVLEHDARTREVGDVADVLLEPRSIR